MKKLLMLSCILLVTLTFFSCKTNKQQIPIAEKKLFGKLSNGQEVYEYTLRNAKGMEAKIINYGAIVVSLTAPDKKGVYADVVLGYDSLDSYEADKSFFGTIVGRYGNRIAKGLFTLDGIKYQLTINNGENHLHGGINGFFKKVWTVENFKAVDTSGSASITLKYVSKDGEEGYPGTLVLLVKYNLTNDNELEIKYTATTDKKTIINPTHHSYFNLTGDMTKTILDHELMIDADKYTPVDKSLITTGTFTDVENTPMDFRSAKKIGRDIDTDYEQLKFGGGYDHNWVLNKHPEKIFKCASLYEASSGRLMEVWTDQPGLQFYSGNFLDGTLKGKQGIMYEKRTGLCLETQVYPDSPNKPDWPSPVLEPGKFYNQTTIYKFFVK